MNDKLKWNIYLKRKKILYMYGLKTGRIHFYEKELIKNLRNVYYGGVPGSILLLCYKLCAGRCYDRSLLITFGFLEDDFELVNADIDSLRLNPSKNQYGDKKSANHSFVIRTKKDGSKLVYDTTLGLVFEKDLYFKIENPKINKINNKQNILDFREFQDIKNANINEDKYVLPLVMPFIEKYANNEMYEQLLKEEISWFKEEIGYVAICEEFNNGLQRLKMKNK